MVCCLKFDMSVPYYLECVEYIKALFGTMRKLCTLLCQVPNIYMFTIEPKALFISSYFLDGWLFVYLQAVGVMSSSHGEDHAMVKEAVQLALENGCTIEKRHTSVWYVTFLCYAHMQIWIVYFTIPAFIICCTVPAFIIYIYCTSVSAFIMYIYCLHLHFIFHIISCCNCSDCPCEGAEGWPEWWAVECSEAGSKGSFMLFCVHQYMPLIHKTVNCKLCMFCARHIWSA